jgi:hypothetical protein
MPLKLVLNTLAAATLALVASIGMADTLPAPDAPLPGDVQISQPAKSVHRASTVRTPAAGENTPNTHQASGKKPGKAAPKKHRTARHQTTRSNKPTTGGKHTATRKIGKKSVVRGHRKAETKRASKSGKATMTRGKRTAAHKSPAHTRKPTVAKKTGKKSVGSRGGKTRKISVKHQAKKPVKKAVKKPAKPRHAARKTATAGKQHKK